MDNSKIEWTGSTWNFCYGCLPVSAGCRNCYAAMQAFRFHKEPGELWHGLTSMSDSGVTWTGDMKIVAKRLLDPLKWKDRRDVFVLSMSDIGAFGIPQSLFDAVVGIMAIVSLRSAENRHRFQLLTKRTDSLFNKFERSRRKGFSKLIHLSREYLESNGVELSGGPGKEISKACDYVDHMGKRFDDSRWPLKNVIVGATVENQPMLEKRVPELREIQAAGHFLSAEPLLSPLDFSANGDDYLDGIDTVIVGGESGNRAREMKEKWVRDIIHQCKDRSSSVFVKQMGAVWARKNGGTLKTNKGKGNNMKHWPTDLRIREMTEKGL